MNPLRHLKNRKLQAGLALVAALLAVAFWPSAVAVDTALAARGTLRVTVDEEGETRVRHRFVVSAPVAGRVLRIALEPGDPVRRGQTVVATFMPAAPAPLDLRSRAEAEAGEAAARATLGGARAERERARAALSLAESERERHRELASQRIVSRQVLEARETEARASSEALRAAEFAVATAEQQLEMARARLMQGASGSAGRAITLRSPIDGVVFKRLRESEAVVAAGVPLLEIGDPRGLEIVSDLLSTDAVKVAPGAAVLLEQWGGDHPIRALVRRVEPSGFMKISALGVEEQRVNVVMDFEDPLEAWSALGDGYRVEVRIVVWEGDGVLKVPASSLFRRGEDWAVFATQGGRAVFKKVEVGRRNGSEAQILSGLGEGESVVLHPSDSLRDGSRITPRAR
ncbi:MAG TPA: efflux RND transporter periplasmic adaptor subunit [Vicinamibacteria bacterium]